MKITNKLFSYDRIFAKGQISLPSGDILQIAELSLIKNGEISEHIQHCDEITYVVSGRATVYYDDKCLELSKGQIHYIKQGPNHRIVADSEQNFHYFCIGFVPNADEVSTRVFFDTISNMQDFVLEDEGNIQALFNLLINEFYMRDEESNVMIQCYFCQMLILLYRILNGKSKEKLSKVNTSTSNNAVYQTLKYIDKHYIKLTSVKEIAKTLSYSEYYLSHAFKEKMDMTIKDYLLQKKIMIAAELLKTSAMSISDIAEQLHFSSLHSFGVAFKRYMNMSASEFRKKLFRKPSEENEPLE